MASRDYRGDPVTGAAAGAVEVFERGLAAFRCWRGDPIREAQAALERAPEFVMAHALWAHVLLCSRDPVRVRSAAPVLAKAAALPANLRERLHLAVIQATLRDDYEGARSILSELLAAHPRDVLALQVAHAFDYLAGDTGRMVHQVASVSGAWAPDLPGYHAVLAMHAFGLAEAGACSRAEALGLEALAIEPLDARAHHTLAHVFEMSGRPAEGLRWMAERAGAWDGDTFVATHCWWHLALYHLERGELEHALGLYDRHIAPHALGTVAGLIDASSLLWRVALLDADVAGRWAGVAAGWAAHVADGFCTFNDMHAMMALVGARDWTLAARLLRELGRHRRLPTRYGSMTRTVGLPVCRALLAFGFGNDPEVVRVLVELPPVAHRLGGSHPQRGVIDLTLRAARARAAERRRLHDLAA